jgi:proteasome lid subunit RPN8/RPN11
MRIRQDAMEAVEAHGAEGYPDEICGVLVGRRSEKTVLESKRARNFIGEEGSRWPDLGAERTRDRYELHPQDHMRIEREAEQAGLEIMGYYHSHPDHPAQASIFDASNSWSGYVYLIVAVEKGKPVDKKAFVADEDGGPFRTVAIEVI